MQKGRPSETAQLSAMMRAAHPLIDPGPSIFIDELAAAFCGLADDGAILAAQQTFEQELARAASEDLARAWVRASRLSLAVRARYAEEALSEAIRRGVTQYVILAAGYDSFAYSRCDPSRKLQIYEVDHPDTQQAKLERLRAAGVGIPSNVTYVPIDFEAQSITEALDQSGFRRNEPAQFCMLGVTLYLSDEAIDQTARQIASCAEGSELVLDYLLPEPLLDEQGRRILQMVRAMAARRGEPAGNCFAPARIGRQLAAAGFARISHFDDTQANARYFAGRGDGLRFPKLLNLARAGVGRESQRGGFTE